MPAATTLWVAAIDDKINEHAYIVPGLGDAGDLAFGEKLDWRNIGIFRHIATISRAYDRLAVKPFRQKNLWKQAIGIKSHLVSLHFALSVVHSTDRKLFPLYVDSLLCHEIKQNFAYDERILQEFFDNGILLIVTGSTSNRR